MKIFRKAKYWYRIIKPRHMLGCFLRYWYRRIKFKVKWFFASKNAKKLQSLKEQLIGDALSSPAGRQALAQAMVEPIRRQLDYSGVGRRVFSIEPLPVGAHATYDIGPAISVRRDNGDDNGDYTMDINEVSDAYRKELVIFTLSNPSKVDKS